MKDLYNLLDSYFKNDKDIKIIYHEDDIFQKIDFIIDERYNFRNLLIYIRNEMIYIDDINEDEEINLFSINSILYEFDNIKINLLILHFIKDFIDIIE